MRALVTGATGFLGGRLAEMLLERGAEVTVLARRPEALQAELRGRVRAVRGSLTDEAALVEAVQGATHVFHCAAASTDWAADAVFFESNVLGTERLLAAAETSATLARFVHVSTTDVYGYPRVSGDESLAMVDRGLGYNRTKIAGERAVWAAASAGMPVTVMRPATIWGPRGGPLVMGIVDELRRGTMLLVAGGRVRAGLVYVDDVAEAMIGGCGHEVARGQAYNLCAGSDVTWGEYVGGLAAGLGLKAPWPRLPFGAAMTLAGVCEAPFRVPGVPGRPLLAGRPLLTRHAVYLLGRDQEFAAGKARAEFGWEPRGGIRGGDAADGGVGESGRVRVRLGDVSCLCGRGDCAWPGGGLRWLRRRCGGRRRP